MQKTNQKRNLFPLFLYICPEPVAIKDQVMQDGTTIHQRDFHAGATQIWDIELYNGGPYYTITSTAPETSGFYLGTVHDTATEYALVILRSETVTDGMLWDISLNARTGYHVIKPKVSLNTNTVFASIQTSAATATNGSALALQIYQNNSVYNDEWRLYSVRSVGTLDIKVYADNAYVEQHSDYQDRIDTIMSRVWEFYRLEFGINISYSTVVNTYTSVADECEVDNSSACSCTTECDVHHKSVEVFQNQVQSLDSTAQTILVFSGHKLCEGTIEQHELYNVYGFAWADKYACITASDEPLSQEISTTVHEIGHWFGAQDHYDIGGEPSTNEINVEKRKLEDILCHSNCLYGENKESALVQSNLRMCAGCRDDISANADRFSGQ